MIVRTWVNRLVILIAAVALGTAALALESEPPDAQKTVEALIKRIEQLEERLQRLESRRTILYTPSEPGSESGPVVTIPTLPRQNASVAPQLEQVPQHWHRKEFNGSTYYIVPLTKKSEAR